MKLNLFYVVRQYTNPDSIAAFGELRYKAGPFSSWIEADSELSSMLHSEGHIIVRHAIYVDEETD